MCAKKNNLCHCVLQLSIMFVNEKSKISLSILLIAIENLCIFIDNLNLLLFKKKLFNLELSKIETAFLFYEAKLARLTTQQCFLLCQMLLNEINTVHK